MVFTVNIGFNNLPNPSANDEQGKTCALFIGDTVQVVPVSEGQLGGMSFHFFHALDCYSRSGPAVELTGASKKKLRNIAIFLGVSYVSSVMCT